jgi:hypothetical protein
MKMHHCIANLHWQSRVIVIVVALWGLVVPVARGETVLIHPRAESASDTRYQYDWAVLLAAMEKTRATFGPFDIKEAQQQMAPSRVAYEMQSADGIINIFVRSTTVDLEKRFLPIRIPVDRGILSYRILLVRNADLPRFAAVRNLDDLRNFRIGQGKGWADVAILRSSQFKVVEGESYDGLFAMLSAERFDAFSRSIDEALREYDKQHDANPTMAVEPTLLLHYPLPRYFFVRRDAQGTLMAKRIESGLEMMVRDGSLTALFLQFKGEQIKQAQLDKRRILHIPNPLLPPETPLGRAELWFDPFEQNSTGKKK